MSRAPLTEFAVKAKRFQPYKALHRPTKVTYSDTGLAITGPLVPIPTLAYRSGLVNNCYSLTGFPPPAPDYTNNMYVADGTWMIIVGQLATGAFLYVSINEKIPMPVFAASAVSLVTYTDQEQMDSDHYRCQICGRIWPTRQLHKNEDEDSLKVVCDNCHDAPGPNDSAMRDEANDMFAEDSMTEFSDDYSEGGF